MIEASSWPTVLGTALLISSDLDYKDKKSLSWVEVLLSVDILYKLLSKEVLKRSLLLVLLELVKHYQQLVLILLLIIQNQKYCYSYFGIG